MLRRKAQRVPRTLKLLPGSHDYKALVEIIETYPRDELFQIKEDELYEIALGVLHLGERRRVRLFVRRDVFGRFLSCLVYLRARRFDTRNATGSRTSSRRSSAASARRLRRASPTPCLARLHYIVYTSRAVFPTTTCPRSRPARRGARTWTDDLRDALAEYRWAGLFECYRRRSPVPTATTSRPGRPCSTSSGSSGSNPTATWA